MGDFREEGPADVEKPVSVPLSLTTHCIRASPSGGMKRGERGRETETSIFRLKGRERLETYPA